MVRKSADVRRHLERHLGLWQQNQFDLLVQEAERCDRGLLRTGHSVVDEESIIHVFTRLMLHGRVRAAVRWETERTKGIVLTWLKALQLSWMFFIRSTHSSPTWFCFIA